MPQMRTLILIVVLLALALVAPFFVYPVFLMKALCFAIFACAFNLLIGYVGLLSFGHAAYIAAHVAKVWGWPIEAAILSGVRVVELIDEKGLRTISDAGALESAVTAAIADSPKAVEDFKAGKQQAIGAIIGKVMKQAKGADAAAVREMIVQRLQAR